MTATVLAPAETTGGITPFTAPFPIDFYGTTGTDLSVDANGYVGFGTGTTDTTNLREGFSYGTPLLSAFTGNLSTGTGGGVYAETRGTGSDRQLVIEWDVLGSLADDGPATARFQEIFTEGSLRVQTLYARTLDWSGRAPRGWIGTMQDDTTASNFLGDNASYPADGSGLDITPTGLTATTDASGPNGHPTVAGEALDIDTDVTVDVYAGTDTTATPVASETATPADPSGAYSVSISPTDLPGGDYTVQATQSGLGHEHASVAQAFSVDETAPAPTMTSGPTGRVRPSDVDSGATSSRSPRAMTSATRAAATTTRSRSTRSRPPRR